MRALAILLGTGCLAVVGGVLAGSSVLALLLWIGLILCLEVLRPIP